MKKFTLISLLIVCTLTVVSGREVQTLNDNWTFRFSHQVSGRGTRVDLPHTWNSVDALIGKIDYKRGIGNYEKELFVSEELRGKRLFLRFEGANTVANLFVNGKHIGEHRGGYAAFIFEVTDHVEYNKKNKLWVRVNNAEQLDIMPLVGDFNFYGGLYRGVTLLITDALCISPLDHASSGVYLRQDTVSKALAQVTARVLLSNESAQPRTATLQLRLFNDSRQVVDQQQSVTLPANSSQLQEIPFTVTQPRLWNGVTDPFAYRTEVTLLENNLPIDKVEQTLGLRFYHVDPDKGFFLNGEHLPLRGVCRHQDRSEVGNALHPAHHDEDMALILEMGANAIRLSHYQHADYFMNLLDKSGVVAWAEIPFVGPGGYLDKGFVNQDSFKANGRQQLIELIRQNYNHPSICFWGLFNELKETGDNPVEYVKELNTLAQHEDPTRPTTAASNQNGALNGISDLIAWNRYDGWYGGMPQSLGTFLDHTHQRFPAYRIGISEYGAGASIYHQLDTLAKTNPTSLWHPENWQTFYHIENWKVINERPFVWGTFIWNMFDFGAAHRTEGERVGRNDKGLVTFDRKERKDAFYFYKANWNSNVKTLHIAEKRNTLRHRSTAPIMVFSNAGPVELFVNGTSLGRKTPDSYCIVRWNDVPLQAGKNSIEVRATQRKLYITDSCEWVVEP